MAAALKKKQSKCAFTMNTTTPESTVVVLEESQIEHLRDSEHGSHILKENSKQYHLQNSEAIKLSNKDRCKQYRQRNKHDILGKVKNKAKCKQFRLDNRVAIRVSEKSRRIHFNRTKSPVDLEKKREMDRKRHERNRAKSRAATTSGLAIVWARRTKNSFQWNNVLMNTGIIKRVAKKIDREVVVASREGLPPQIWKELSQAKSRLIPNELKLARTKVSLEKSIDRMNW
jgi:hypothetical protein